MQFCGLTEGNNLRSVTFGEAVQEKLVQSGEDALVIFKDVGEGLAFVHKKGWIHADLKHNNVVVMKEKWSAWKGVLIDFGNSCSVDNPIKKTQKSSSPWIAPEIRAMRTPYSIKGDIFSFGYLIHSIQTMDFQILWKRFRKYVWNPRWKTGHHLWQLLSETWRNERWSIHTRLLK